MRSIKSKGSECVFVLISKAVRNGVMNDIVAFVIHNVIHNSNCDLLLFIIAKKKVTILCYEWHCERQTALPMLLLCWHGYGLTPVCSQINVSSSLEEFYRRRYESQRPANSWTTRLLRIRVKKPTSVMAYFHCRTQIQIQTWTLIPNPVATWYYAEQVSTDSDLDSDPFPKWLLYSF